jgi:hypothetical protein
MFDAWLECGLVDTVEVDVGAPARSGFFPNGIRTKHSS